MPMCIVAYVIQESEACREPNNTHFISSMEADRLFLTRPTVIAVSYLPLRLLSIRVSTLSYIALYYGVAAVPKPQHRTSPR